MRGDLSLQDTVSRLPWCFAAGWAAVALLRWAARPRAAASIDVGTPERDVEPEEGAYGRDALQRIFLLRHVAESGEDDEPAAGDVRRGACGRTEKRAQTKLRRVGPLTLPTYKYMTCRKRC